MYFVQFQHEHFNLGVFHQPWAAFLHSLYSYNCTYINHSCLLHNTHSKIKKTNFWIYDDYEWDILIQRRNHYAWITLNILWISHIASNRTAKSRNISLFTQFQILIILHGLSIDWLGCAFCTFGQTYKTYRIVQKVQPVRDLGVKRTIREVVQDLRYVLCVSGVGGVCCCLIKVTVMSWKAAVTWCLQMNVWCKINVQLFHEKGKYLYDHLKP